MIKVHAIGGLLRGIFARQRRIVAWTINLCVLSVSLLVALAVAEVAVRMFAPQQLIIMRPDIWMPADTVGWVAKPNIDTRINTGERTVRVRTDASGFRVGGRTSVDPKKSVLLIGDSFIQALQVDYEQSVGGLLERGLATALGYEVVVRNAGVDGWGPAQYLYQVDRALRTQDYDGVVVALYIGNDVVRRPPEPRPPRQPAERKRFRMPRAFTWRELVQSMLRPINDVMEERSHLFVALKNRLSVLRTRLGLSPVYSPQEFLTSNTTERWWDLTADVCADLAATAEAQGVPVLFVFLPTHFQIDDELLNEYGKGMDIDPGTLDLEQPNRLLMREFAERGLRVVDPLEPFRAAVRQGRRLNGRVDRHLSPAGHRELATFLQSHVMELIAPEAR